MAIPEAALLAGFVLAHAAWSVSDLPKGDLLTPLAIVQKGGKRVLMRYAAETQAEAISRGKAAMTEFSKQPDVDAWAFAREGQFNEEGKYVDVITVDAWAKGMSAPVSFVQKFQPFASGKFRLLGEPWVVINGKVQSPQDSSKVIADLNHGIRSHSKAAEHWSEWLAK